MALRSINALAPHREAIAWLILGLGLLAVFYIFVFLPQFQVSEPVDSRTAVPVLSQSDDGEWRPVSLPDSWPATGASVDTLMSYRVELPAQFDGDDPCLQILGFRQHLEVFDGERKLLEAGDRRINWLVRRLSVVELPLEQLAVQDASAVLRLVVFAAAGVPGGLGPVFLIDCGQVERSVTAYVAHEPLLQPVALCLILMSAVFLSIDAVARGNGRLKPLFAVPHIALTLCLLGFPDWMSSLWRLKLQDLSVHVCWVSWLYWGFWHAGLSLKPVNLLSLLIAAVSLPSLFTGDVQHYYAYYNTVSMPVTTAAATLGFVTMLALGHLARHRVAYVVSLVAGSALAAAGLHDVYLLIEFNPEFQAFGMPLASLMVALLLFGWKAADLLSSSLALKRSHLALDRLIAERTRLLDDALVSLSQIRRFRKLNPRGAAIAHELRNPLASLEIDLALHLGPGKDRQLSNKVLARVARSVDRMRKTIDGLIDYSRVNQVARETLSLDELVRDVLADYRQNALPDVPIVTDLHPRVTVSVDRRLLEQLLINLLDNAVAALASTREPIVEIRLRAERYVAVLSVRDNGPGFDESIVDTAVEPLMRAGGQGLGLGLAIVDEIACLHGGKLHMRNVSPGAVISVELPTLELH